MAARTPPPSAALLLAGGALTGLLLPLGAQTEFLLAPLAALACLRTRWRAAFLGSVLGLVCQAGVARPAQLPTTRIDGIHMIVGIVESRERRRLVLQVERIGGQAPAARLRARIDTPSWWWYRPHLALAPGTRIRMVCRVRPLVGPTAERYWHRRGITLRGQARRGPPQVLSRPEGITGALAVRRYTARRRLEELLNHRDAGLVVALVTGERDGLAQSDRALVVGSGQAHLLAVSGLHVGLMLLGLMAVLTVLGAGPRVRAALALLAVLAYVPFTGANPATLRAGLGTSLYLFGRAVGRIPDGRHVLAIVFVASLWLQPEALLGVGIQLSFTAVAGILLFARPMSMTLDPPRPRIHGLRTRRSRLRQALAVSLAAWLSTAPIVAARIGRLAPGSPFVSVLAVPIVTGIVLVGLFTILIPSEPHLDAFLATVLETLVGALREVLAWPSLLGLGARPAAGPGLLHVVAGASSVVLWQRAVQKDPTRPGRARVLLLAWFLMTLSLITPRSAAHTPSPATYNPGPMSAVTVWNSTPSAWFGYVPMLLAFAGLALWRRWLTPGGAVAAAASGAVWLLAFGLPGFAAALVAFLVPTLLGRLPGATRHGARSIIQVGANGAVPVLGAVLALGPEPQVGMAVFCGSLAFLSGDSAATELGTRYGGQPWSLVPGRRVAPGESGGVTRVGLLASAGAASFPVLVFVLLEQVPWVWLGWWTLAGFLGALADSLLGATFQYRGRTKAGRVVESRLAHREATTHVRGMRWLDNDAVNLLGSIAAGLMAWVFWRYRGGGS